MPRIKLTYAKDIQREGTDVLDVDDTRAAALVNLRRAVILDARDELEEKTKAELLEQAVRLGADVTSRQSKAEIIKAIQVAEKA